VNTQKTLPFGTVAEVAQEVESRLKIFSPGGGYVANPVHNIQAGCPVENVIELFRLIRDIQ
jgi:uroporphyrinogen-III decarboxylase